MKYPFLIFCIFIIFPIVLIFVFFLYATSEPGYEYIGSHESVKKKYSSEYNIPKNRIIYAIDWSILIEGIESLIVNSTGSDYKNFIPKDILKLQTNASLVKGLSTSQYVACMRDPDKVLSERKQYTILTKTLHDIICAEEYPNDTLFYQDYSESSETSTTYVVFPRNNLIWISHHGW